MGLVTAANVQNSGAKFRVRPGTFHSQIIVQLDWLAVYAGNCVPTGDKAPCERGVVGHNPFSSDSRRGTGASAGRNHRDFFWPPVFKPGACWRIALRNPPAAPRGPYFWDLGELDEPLSLEINGYAQFLEAIARVNSLAAFAQRPPSNWAAVWLSGEWLRFRAGLSPFSLARSMTGWANSSTALFCLTAAFNKNPATPTHTTCLPGSTWQTCWPTATPAAGCPKWKPCC
jgi:hypothetical protein